VECAEKSVCTPEGKGLKSLFYVSCIACDRVKMFMDCARKGVCVCVLASGCKFRKRGC